MTYHAMTLSRLLLRINSHFWKGTCPKHGVHVAMEDQELKNFKVEEALSIVLCKFVAIIVLLQMKKCRRYSHLLWDRRVLIDSRVDSMGRFPPLHDIQFDLFEYLSLTSTLFGFRASYDVE